MRPFVVAINRRVRANGTTVHDILLLQVMTPEQSTHPWDYDNLIKTVPGEQAFTSKEESTCKL